MRILVVALTWTISGSLWISNALAVTITKPLAGEVVLEENVAEYATITRGGHYATTSGATPGVTLVWTCAPANAIKFDYTPDPVLRHTVRIMCNPGTACSAANPPILLSVTDPSNNSTHTIEINPIKIEWENSHVDTSDRMVGLERQGPGTYERDIVFRVYGKKPIKKEVRVITHKARPDATGEIDIVAYDGDPAHVQEVGPPPTYGGTREWLITVDVTAGCPQPAEHTLTIRGDVRSIALDDIEVDILGVQTGWVNDYDGMGATLLYTVVELDLVVYGYDKVQDEISEANELDPGEYLYTLAGAQEGGSTLHGATAKQVQPQLPGYELRITLKDLPSPETLELRFDDTETNIPDNQIDRGINGGLPFDFDIAALEASGRARETLVVAYIIHTQSESEVGEGTCRDEVSLTAVEVTLTCPTAAPIDDPVPAGNSTTDGNEWTFDGAPPGVLDVYCRATALPDDDVVQAELDDCLIFEITASGQNTPIDGSTLAWSPGDDEFGTAGYAEAAGGLPDRWETRARFTALPADNDQFGGKTVELVLYHPDDVEVAEAWTSRGIQVFFSRDEDNNPGGGGEPNWFYYWSQVYQNPDVHYESTWGGSGRVPGMLSWILSQKAHFDAASWGRRWIPGGQPERNRVRTRDCAHVRGFRVASHAFGARCSRTASAARRRGLAWSGSERRVILALGRG